MDDPWEGFAYYLENLFRVQAGDRGFNDFLSRRFTDNTETRAHPRPDVPTNRRRARPSPRSRRGSSRYHPGPTIVNLIWSLGPIIDATRTTAPNAWRRYPLPHARCLPG